MDKTKGLQIKKILIGLVLILFLVSAFFSFSSRVDALEAKDKLQGYGLHHSILKIDTAVQKKRNNWG